MITQIEIWENTKINASFQAFTNNFKCIARNSSEYIELNSLHYACKARNAKVVFRCITLTAAEFEIVLCIFVLIWLSTVVGRESIWKVIIFGFLKIFVTPRITVSRSQWWLFEEANWLRVCFTSEDAQFSDKKQE